MAFSQDFIEKVRDASNIVDILGEYTSFKNSSRGQHMACCPLPGHNEKTPSFSVSETKQVYHCFGCGKSGNIFDALRELKALNFPEAVEYLANRASIPIPEEMRARGKSDSSTDLRKKYHRVNEIAADFYRRKLLELPEGHPVKKYVSSRGLSSGIVEDFKIGYAPDAWDVLKTEFSKRKVPHELALKLGLLKTRKSGDGQYDMFRHRLMFTIQNHLGDFVGFGGRSLEKDQKPKYINSADSEVFHKSRVMYGLNKTGTFIREKDEVIVVEGYMDFLALYSAGIRNVVATLGTALTDQHARLLKRYTKNVLVFFDGDSAGQKAANRSLPVLLGEGIVPKALLLTGGLDPDDFVKEKGVEALEKHLAEAPELFMWQLSKLMESFSGRAADKVRVMDEVTPSLKSIRDSRLQSLYADEVAQRLGVEPRLVFESLKRGPKVLIPRNPEPEPEVTQNPPQIVIEDEERLKVQGAPKAEIYLLNLALSSSERWKSIWDSEIVGEMNHPGIQKLFALGNQFCGQNPSGFDKLTAYLMTLMDSRKEIGMHLTEAFQQLSEGDKDKMQSDCIEQIHERHLKQKMREITTRMRHQSAQDQLRELEQIVNMNKVKRTSK